MILKSIAHIQITLTGLCKDDKAVCYHTSVKLLVITIYPFLSIALAPFWYLPKITRLILPPFSRSCQKIKLLLLSTFLGFTHSYHTFYHRTPQPFTVSYCVWHALSSARRSSASFPLPIIFGCDNSLIAFTKEIRYFTRY